VVSLIGKTFQDFYETQEQYKAVDETGDEEHYLQEGEDG
jgi:hypothetical protein